MEMQLAKQTRATEMEGGEFTLTESLTAVTESLSKPVIGED